MNRKYEVRVTQTHVDYYHVAANTTDEATALVRQHVIKGDGFPVKVETIKRTPVIDYALELTADGAIII